MPTRSPRASLPVPERSGGFASPRFTACACCSCLHHVAANALPIPGGPETAAPPTALAALPVLIMSMALLLVPSSPLALSPLAKPTLGRDDPTSEYERSVAPQKQQLFSALLSTLPRHAIVVDVGAGPLPNARFYAETVAGQTLEIIAIDSEAAVEPYVQEAVREAHLPERGHSLQFVEAAAEELPLDDASADAVVFTLALCTVSDPRRALMEARRILRPGGQLLFWEHVLSETDEVLAAEQRAATATEVERWGCHLDRRTLQTLQAAGFAPVPALSTNLEASCYFELGPDFGVLSPTVAGLARVAPVVMPAS